MENWEAAPISRRANDCVPAKSVPLELSAYSLFLLRFVLNVRANISCVLSLCFCLFSLCVCHASRPLPLSLSVCLSLPRPQGFLKNERDNALLSAIEESRRRVSICPVSDCFSGRKRAAFGWQNLILHYGKPVQRHLQIWTGQSQFYFHYFSFFTGEMV